MPNTKKASLKDLREMYTRAEAKAPRSDAPVFDMPEGFWDAATPQMPKSKTPVSLRVDPDILDYFKGQGDGHLTRMHSVLRAYVDAHKKDRSPRPSS